ncbi:hypothetical protein LEN26_020677 [Aphanomyces euteiches]|nr:hypothetical protein LEN26_020677 [Aphanomyces euteiches]
MNVYRVECRGSHYRVNDDVDNISVSFKEISGMPGVPSVYLDNFIAGHGRLPTDGLMAHNPPLSALRLTPFKFQPRYSGALAGSSSTANSSCASTTCRIGISFGHVYCCCIINEGDRRFLVPHLMTMPVFELTWRSLLHISLDALWVKKLQEGEKDIGNFSERSQSLKSTFSHRHTERRSIAKKTTASRFTRVASILGPKAK